MCLIVSLWDLGLVPKRIHGANKDIWLATLLACKDLCLQQLPKSWKGESSHDESILCCISLGKMLHIFLPRGIILLHKLCNRLYIWLSFFRILESINAMFIVWVRLHFDLPCSVTQFIIRNTKFGKPDYFVHSDPFFLYLHSVEESDKSISFCPVTLLFSQAICLFQDI